MHTGAFASSRTPPVKTNEGVSVLSGIAALYIGMARAYQVCVGLTSMMNNLS